MKIRIAVFFGCLAFAALIAWLGGYNFDQRNGLVAYFTVVAVSISALISFGLVTTKE